jgi:hypothetical protein
MNLRATAGRTRARAFGGGAPFGQRGRQLAPFEGPAAPPRAAHAWLTTR